MRRFSNFWRKPSKIEGEMAKMSAASGHFYREQKLFWLGRPIFPTMRCCGSWILEGLAEQLQRLRNPLQQIGQIWFSYFSGLGRMRCIDCANCEWSCPTEHTLHIFICPREETMMAILVNRNFGLGRPIFPTIRCGAGPLGRSGGTASTITQPFTTPRPVCSPTLVWWGLIKMRWLATYSQHPSHLDPRQIALIIILVRLVAEQLIPRTRWSSH